METPQTTNPHLASIGHSLGRSIQRHFVENDLVQSAFDDLAFELDLARQIGEHSIAPEILEPTI